MDQDQQKAGENEPDHNQTLNNTNKLLHDLERKLSSSSNQTHASNNSQTSSIIINKDLSGLGKQNVQSNVINYLKNNDNASNFSTNELYHDRQTRFMTKFGRNYNPPIIQQHTESIENSTNSEQSSMTSPIVERARPLISNDQNDDDFFEHIDDADDLSDSGSVIKHSNDYDTDEEEGTFTPDSNENLHGIHYGNMDDYDDYDYDDDAEEEDDMLLPPSPPRSPPRDLDPDKLYGLYDFSGPDPSHCSLSRDEPVVLINDSDNYWWLIKKLTKQERFELSRSKHLTYNLDDDFDDFDDFSDSEDGKIGFVPAECLETYGERLARLNCFKNEALEKSSKEDINDTTLSYADDFNLGLNLSNPINFQSDDNLSKSTVGSLKRKKSTKSVTFEDLGELVLDEDTNDSSTSIHKNNDDDFHNSYFDIPRDEIRDVIKNNPKEPSETSNSEDKKSEVLSDVYPTETPLIINKNNRSGQKSQDSPPLDGSSPKDPIRIISDNEPIITHVVNLNEKSNQQKSEVAVKSEENLSLSNVNKNTHLDKPSMSTSNQEIISIGSFSPDTPRESSRNKKSNKKSISSPPSCPSSANSSTSPANRSIDDEASQFRRSLILDRLNQVTFDIQEQLNLSDEDSDHFSHYYRPDNLTFGADLKHSPEQHRMIHDVINQSDSDSDQPSDLDSESFVNSSSNHTNSRDLSNKHHRHNGHHNHHHHSSISQDQDLSVTPLTSLNSLSNGINSTTMTQFSNTSNSKAYYNNIHAIIPEDEDITVSPTPLYPSSLPESQTNPDFIPKASDIPLSERRKSKPVHDMFLPILGKFDDLAEKLAELEDLL